jgi:Uma2 family endonuclease
MENEETVMSKTAVVLPPTQYTRTSRLPIPPLQPGDRLSRREFARRYEAMPHIKKAELIEGVVYMPSPVHFSTHSEPHAHIIGWLVVYAAATPGVQLGDNATVILDADNEVQPDVLLRLAEDKGGQSRINAKDYVEGSPELVVEIAASSASIDLHDKKHIYRRNGVQEYLVWEVYDGRITWFYLDEGEYQPLPPDDNGIFRSRVFPGLWLAAVDLLRGELTAVLQTVRDGLQTEEHKQFVAKINQL